VDLTSYLELISGRNKSLAARTVRCALWVLSWGYGLAVTCRNGLFDCGLRKTHRASVPVISIGNLTTGGTGKTPVVAYLANWFTVQGLQVGILSRGYRSLENGDNDEKRMLDQLCPDIPHLQNPDRVAAAKQAVSKHSCELLLLDDGFQHRRLQRDLNIVLIDAANPFGYGRLLPRGLLREPLSGLKRANLIIITRADQIDRPAKQQIIDRIAQIRGTAEHVELCFPPIRLVNFRGRICDWAQIQSLNVAAFCGIGNPDGFQQTLADAGLNIVCFQAFADHHHYDEPDLKMIVNIAKEQNAQCLLTTSKDLVKIPHNELEGLPLWALQIGVEITAGHDVLEAKLKAFGSNKAVAPPE